MIGAAEDYLGPSMEIASLKTLLATFFQVGLERASFPGHEELK